MARIQDILVRIGGDASGLSKSLAQGNKDLAKFEAQVQGTVSALSRVAVIIGGGMGFAKLAGEALAFADATQRIADQTGLTTEQVQRLGFIASQTGNTVDQVTGAINKMQLQLVKAADGSKAQAEAFELLNINTETFFRLNPEQQFAAIAKEIAATANPADQTAKAVAAFGKAGADMLPMLKAMGKDMEVLGAKFDAIGGAVSEEAIAKVDKLGDEFSSTGQAARGLATELLGVIAPAIIAGLNKIQELIGGIRILAGQGSNEIVNVGREIAAVEKRLAGAQNSVFASKLVPALEQELVLLKAKEQALIDAPYKEALAKIAAQKIVDAQAPQEFEDIIVRANKKGQAEFDTEQFWRNEKFLAEANFKKSMEDMEVSHQETMRLIESEALNERMKFMSMTLDMQIATVADKLVAMTQQTAQHSKTMFMINKVAAIAQATIDGIQSTVSSYKFGANIGGPYVGAAFAAVAAAAALANLNAIKSTQFQGGGGGLAPSNATAPAVPTTPAGGGGAGAPGAGNGGVMRVEGLTGDSIISGVSARAIAEKLLQFQEDGGKVVFT